MSDAIQCIDGALSKISPSKNKLEMMKEINDFEKLVQSKENEVVHLQDIIQTSEQATKQALEERRKMAIEKGKLLELLFAKQREIDEQMKLIAHQSQEYQKQLSDFRLKENESLELQQQLDDLQSQLTEVKTLLSKANRTVKSLTDDNIQLKADMTSIKILENTLKSKNDVIKILESELQTPPSYKDQKDMIQPLLAQRFKKRR